MNPYETDKLLSEYLLFHYGAPEQVVSSRLVEMLPYTEFAVRAVRDTLQTDLLPPKARALDVGCAVGRSSFELARHCEEVIGMDFSHRFITAAKSVRESGLACFDRIEEGRLATPLQNFLPQEIRRHRVQFEQGDAMHLRENLGSFDVVLAANLIDRLTQPLKFLQAVPKLVRAGGQLIVTSPYTWLEEFTPRENWLGGFQENETPLTTLEGLQRALPDFLLLKTCELPFLIREHARKYQWSVAEATVWVRK